MTIKFDACSGVHIIKREHLDEEGERTICDVEAFDLFSAGFVSIAAVRKFIGAGDINGLEDFLCEGPDVDEARPAVTCHAPEPVPGVAMQAGEEPTGQGGIS